MPVFLVSGGKERWKITCILGCQLPKNLPKSNGSYLLKLSLPYCRIFYFLYIFNISIPCEGKTVLYFKIEDLLLNNNVPASISPLCTSHIPGTEHFVLTHLCAFACAVPSPNLPASNIPSSLAFLLFHSAHRMCIMWLTIHLYY